MKKRAPRKTARPKAAPKREAIDPYLELIREHWTGIHALYVQFEEKKPLLLFVLDEGKVYCVPYDEYRAGLSERSQASLEKQYQDACATHSMVIFVRDDTKEILRSYTLPV